MFPPPHGERAVNFINNQGAMFYFSFFFFPFKKSSMLFCTVASFVVVFENLTIRKELLVYNMIAEINKMPDFRDEFEFHILWF